MSDDKKRPLIFPSSRKPDAVRHHETGAGETTTGSIEPPRGGWDSSYVPGFSELRHANKYARTAQGRRAGYRETELPANLAWIRYAGEGDYRGMIEWRKKGYEIITVDPETGKAQLLEQYGWSLPPASQITSDHMIRRDDTVLAYCDGETHKKNIREHAEYREFMQGASTQATIEMETEEKRKIRVGPDDAVFD